MTGPKRDLPPLNIQITADPSSALEAYKKVAGGAKKMAGQVQSALGDMSKSFTTELSKPAAKQAKQAKQYSDSVQSYLFGGASDISKSVKISRKARVQLLKQSDAFYKNQLRQDQAAVEAKTKADAKEARLQAAADKRATSRMWARKRSFILARRKEAEERAKDLAKANADLAARVKSGAIAQRIQARQDHQEERRQSRRRWQRRRDFIIGQRQAAEEAAAEQHRVTRRMRLRLRDRLIQQKKDAEEAAAEQHRITRRMRIRQRDRLIRQREEAAEAARENARITRRMRMRQRDTLRARQQQGQQLRQRAGALFGGQGASMMGARADMFMHTGALQNMGGMAANFLTPYAQVENATIQMRAYAGSAEMAQKAISELQRFAIESPYKLEGVLEAANHLMKYGTSAENAINITKMLGDVAGGNTAKLELLALATAQATGFGKLQGQELRQLVNAGFNPLQTAAEQMAGGPGADPEAIKAQMKILLDAMRAGQLSSDIIQAALEVETSVGGKFFGITKQQATSMLGWANQFLETLDLIKIQITEAFADELKAAMGTVVEYTQATVDWMKANKQLVKEYVYLGLKILKAVIAFHLLGAALAYTKWVMGTLTIITKSFGFVLGMVRLGVEAMALSTNKSTSSWGKWLQGIGMSILKISRLAGGIIGLALLLQGVFGKEGFTGLSAKIGSLFSNTLGFLYNIGYNLTGIFDFIGKNWHVMLVGMLTSTLNIVDGMMSIFAKLVSFIPGAGDISNAMYAAIPDLQKSITEMLIGDDKLDTSMFKFDGPSLGDLPYMEDAKNALAPFMPKSAEEIAKEAPNTDFTKFMMGGGAGAGQMREHTVAGSSEHAMRMYQYGQQAVGQFDAQKKTHEKKTEDLLTRIEKNTRPAGPSLTQTTLMDANIMMNVMGA